MPKVLIVDDDSALRVTLAEVIGLAGYHTIQAEDGPTALARVAGERPDVVLMDVMMPGMSGLEVVEKLRADPANADLPIIMVTALSDVRDRVRGLAAGATDYVDKPFETAELLARIEAALRQRKLMRDLAVARATTARVNHELVVSDQELRAEAAADIHDGILQTLVAVRMWAERLSDDEALPIATRAEAVGFVGQVDTSIATGRRLLRGLTPPPLSEGGLPSLVRSEAEIS